MTKVELEIHDDIVAVINKIKSVNDTGIELVIPDGSVLFDSVLNLKLLEKESEKLNKIIHLNTSDENGIALIKMINEETDEDFTTKEVDLKQDFDASAPAKKRKIPLTVPKLPKLKLPGGKIVILAIIVLAIVAFVGYQFIYKVPKAEVRIVVSSQPLTKSVEIKVVKDGNTSAETSTLKGYEVSTLVTKTDSAETTGEKLIGDKAEGKIKIFNRTDEEIKLKDGTNLTFKKDGDDLDFVLDDDVTVPAESLQDPTDPTSPSVPGEAEADITAAEIGKDYNIDDNETLEFEDYKKSELFALTDGETSGGKSEAIKVITEEDKTTLSAKIFDEGSRSAEEELLNSKKDGKKYVKGSAAMSIKNELFSAEVGEEEEKLELTQEISALGLGYSEKELEDLLEELLGDLIPEGFTLSSDDKDIKVEVLGTTETTTLSNTETDLQVTIKAFVVPDINEEELKKELVNKPISEAERILGGIKNVKTYGLTVSPNIPLLQKTPKNEENIKVEIVKE